MDVLSLVDFISPNMAELEAMARAALLKHNLCLTNTSQLLDRSVPKELQKARPWLQILLQQCSVGNIIVTLGAAGAAVCTLSSDKQYIDIHHAPALPVDRIENTSGAGDCLVAGMMHSLLEKRNNHTDALAAGIAAARQAICSEYNVPPSLNINQLRSDARNVKISFFQFSLY
jgi:sugar/nucleoside kinase (ribokinase family)